MKQKVGSLYGYRDMAWGLSSCRSSMNIPYLKIWCCAYHVEAAVFSKQGHHELIQPSINEQDESTMLDCEALSSQTGRCLLFAQRRHLRCLALASLLTLPTDTSCLRSYATCTFQTQTFTSQQQHHHHQVTNLQAPTKKTTAAAPN